MQECDASVCGQPTRAAQSFSANIVGDLHKYSFPVEILYTKHGMAINIGVLRRYGVVQLRYDHID